MKKRTKSPRKPPSLRSVYMAAKNLSDYMRTNSGAATGELVAALHKAVTRYEDYELQHHPAREFL